MNPISRRHFLGAAMVPGVALATQVPGEQINPRASSQLETDFLAASHLQPIPRREDINVLLDGTILLDWREANASTGVILAWMQPERTYELGHKSMRMIPRHRIMEGRVQILFRDEEARQRHFAAFGTRGLAHPPEFRHPDTDLWVANRHIVGPDIGVTIDGRPAGDDWHYADAIRGIVCYSSSRFFGHGMLHTGWNNHGVVSIRFKDAFAHHQYVERYGRRGLA